MKIFLALLVLLGYAAVSFAGIRIKNQKILAALFFVVVCFTVVAFAIGIIGAVSDALRGALPIQYLSTKEMFKRIFSEAPPIVLVVVGIVIIDWFFDRKPP